ncbi:MAG: tetratricopeptide repeat protein [Succinivibrionaceae bacterium]|nr:sel1 repeat family protein [Succinivibrionaceae bacterium]MDY6337531.1 tetratricopeptide repeat protein [Succinivibrionaceae bacterium]
MTTSAFPHRYLKAAEQGNASGEYALALMYRDGDGVGQNHAEAARWFRKAASHGQPDAARNLAEAYRKGLGVPRDEAAAQKWQRKFDENFSQLLRRH